MGVIATLTAGFETVNRRLWLLLFPIGLDLVLWCGPQLSVIPIVRQAATLWITSPMASSYDPQQIVSLRQGLETFGRSFNLLALLSLSVPGRDASVRLVTAVLVNVLGVPTLVTDRGEAMTAAPIQARPIQITDPWLLGLATVVLFLLGVALSAGFLGVIAQIVRDGEVELPALMRGLVPNAIRLASYLVLGCTLLILVSFPLLAFAMPLFLATPTISMLLVITPWLWLGFYLFFAPGAMLMNQVNPARAVWYSLNVMRVDPWRVMGLVVGMSVIQAGLPMLWDQLMIWPWGVLLGIVGNAYVGTGLAAAYMIFYRDRYRLWRELAMVGGAG